MAPKTGKAPKLHVPDQFRSWISNIAALCANPVPVGKISPQIHFLLAIQAIAIASYIWFFARYNYLPIPFVSDKHDTFMDFYHTAFWSGQSGRYTEWSSVYPPLVFLVFKLILPLFGSDGDYANAFQMRAEWPFGSVLIWAIAISSLAITLCSPLYARWRLRDRAALFGFLLLSPPILFTIERGNIILLLVPLLAVAAGRTGWRRAWALAVMINIKPYCVLLLFAYLIKGEWRWFCNSVAISGTIYIASGLLVDSNFPLMLFNLVSYSGDPFIYAPISIQSMVASFNVFSYSLEYDFILKSTDFGTPSHAFELASMIKLANMAAVLAPLAYLVRRRDTVAFAEILIFLMIAMSCITISVGGYSLIALAAAAPVLARLRFGWVFFWSIVLIFCPLDWIVRRFSMPLDQEVYLSGMVTPVYESAGAGGWLRPLLNLLLLQLAYAAYPGRTAQRRPGAAPAPTTMPSGV